MQDFTSHQKGAPRSLHPGFSSNKRQRRCVSRTLAQEPKAQPVEPGTWVQILAPLAPACKLGQVT